MSLSVVFGVKRWISKSYSHYWKGFKYTKMLENQRICGTADGLTVQDKQGTHEQLSLPCPKHNRNVMGLMVIMGVVLVLMETIMVSTGM